MCETRLNVIHFHNFLYFKSDSKPANGKGTKGVAKAAAAEDDANANKPQNPYIALTHREIFQLKMSWKAIRRTLEETGVNMFIL